MKRRRILFACMALIILVSGFPTTLAAAADDTEMPDFEIFEPAGGGDSEPLPENDGGYMLADRPAPEGFSVPLPANNSLLNRDRAYPDSYVSPYVTSVKDQGGWGTCWAFSTVGTAESDLVKNNGEDKDTLDLSEIQLAYFTYHSVEDELGGLAGDIVELEAGSDFLNAGGNRLVTSFKLASWVGLTEEDSTSPVTYDNVDTSTTLPDSLSFNEDYATLRNAIWINPEDSDGIKQMVSSYGAVSISYYVSGTYYNSETGAYFYDADPEDPNTEDPNHAVIIVGWDDNYAASNFVTGHQPTQNGAWLVKNSWGTGWGNSGYFWLSYEDVGFLSDGNYCVAYDMGQSSDYLHNYQYDGNGALSILGVNGATSSYMANVFTAASNEALKSVMFAISYLNTNVDYSIQVYTDPNPGDPTSGTACLSTPVTGFVTYPGYYTVDLNSLVNLNAGQTFSVVVYLSAEEQMYMPTDSSEVWPWVRMVGSAAGGQSYVSIDGTSWWDTDSIDNANVRVKALTVPRVVNTCTITAALNNAAYGTVTGGGEYDEGESVTLKATPKAGYRFVCWKKGNTQVSTSATYTFTASADAAYTAEFAAIGTPSLTATPASYSSVKLTWNKITGASGYEVYRAVSGGSYAKVYTATSGSTVSYTNTGLATGTTYNYKVRAYCKAGATTYGSYSSVKSAKPSLATPTMTAASASYSSVKVSWNAISGASGYRIYRATSSTGTYSLLKTTTSTSYTNTGLTTGKTYYYKVRAYRTVSGSPVYGSYSSVKSAKPVPAIPTSVKAAKASSTSIKVSWGSVSGASGYEVYRATSKTGTYTKVKATTSTSFTNTGLTKGKTYYYKVRAYRTVSGKKVYGSYSSIVYYKL